MWLPFAMPLLIGPPSILAMGTLDLEWIGAAVTFAGTFFVTRDNIHSASAPLKNAVALGLTFVFCACWIAISWLILAGLALLLPETASD